MIEKIEYKGKWFLPNSDTSVSGTLTYMPDDSIILEIIGGLNGEGDIFDTVKANNNCNIIYGDAYNTSNNNFYKITLINCTGSWTCNIESNFPIIRYNVQHYLVGIHLNGLEDKIFDKAVARIDSLSEWCNPGIINTYFTTTEDEITCRGIYFNSDKVKERIVSTEISDSLQLIISKDLDYKRSDLNASMTQHTELEILPADKITIDDIRQKLYIFEQFMSFMSLSNVYVSKIVLYDYNEYQELSNGDKLYKKIDFYYLNPEKSDISKELLVKYHEIADSYPEMIKKWYDVSEDIAPIRNHMVRSLKHRASFDSTDFVLVAHALEGYHTRFIDNSRRELKYRYTGLLTKFKGLAIIENLKFDIKEAVDSRNYYSHFFIKGSKHKVLDGRELHKLYRQMRVLLICCILDLTGHDINSINKIITSSNSYILKL